MATTFLGTNVWTRIKTLNSRRGQRLVAVPYLGENSLRRLTLRAGDVLVVRLDLATVKTGQTSPKDVLAYLKNGVEVHKQANLHAKVSFWICATLLEAFSRPNAAILQDSRGQESTASSAYASAYLQGTAS